MNKIEPKTITPASRTEWRKWLMKNHKKEDSVWLVYLKKIAGLPGITYTEAVEEALCFGWIDSKAQTLDRLSYRQFFSKRKPNSVWSKLNKTRVAKLMGDGLMTEAGLASIEIAKQNGSWNLLDSAEALIIPDDMAKSLRKYPKALTYFEGLSKSDKRNILQWLTMAKREETRKKRIQEIVEQARLQKKPKQF